MAYHRNKKKKNSDRFMSGVLYTPEKVPVSKQDFSPKRQSPGKEKILKKINELGESAAISTRSRKEYRAYVSKRRRVRHSEGYQQQRLRDATFYGGISIASICIILITAFITSGVIGNMTSTTVALNDNGRVTYASTSARSVNDFLAKNSITVGSGDVLNVSLNDSISEGETIEIRRALPLTIHNGTEVIELNMLAGTVGEALEKAGVEVTVDDEVYPAASSYITAGMTISVIHVTYEYVTENEVIHFKEVTKISNSLAYGDKILQTEGQNGVQQNTIKVTYKNGKEVSRETVKQEVTKKAVDRVVLVGTYVEPKPQPSSGSNSSSNSGSGSSSSNSGGSGSSSGNSNSGGGNHNSNNNGSGGNDNSGGDTGADNAKDDTGKLTEAPSVSQIHSGSLSEHKAVPEPASSIIAKTLVMDSITAYTHTGNRTATGTWPRIGTIAADPKQIPYGTKIYVPGYGYGRIEDTGSNRHGADYYCIDLFMETEADCRSYGRKRDVKIYILK